MSSMFAILIKSGLVYVWDNNISGLGLRQDTYASSVQERHQLWQQNKLVIILKVFCWWRGLMIRFLRNNLCTKQHSVRSRCSMGQLLSNRNHNHPSFHNNHITDSWNVVLGLIWWWFDLSDLFCDIDKAFTCREPQELVLQGEVVEFKWENVMWFLCTRM